MKYSSAGLAFRVSSSISIWQRHSHLPRRLLLSFKPGARQILEQLASLLSNLNDFSSASISANTKEWITAQNIGFGSVMMPLRLSLVGEMKGPDLFEIASILGKEETILRLNKAISFLS